MRTLAALACAAALTGCATARPPEWSEPTTNLGGTEPSPSAQRVLARNLATNFEVFMNVASTVVLQGMQLGFIARPVAEPH
jgi:hypothetical protein